MAPFPPLNGAIWLVGFFVFKNWRNFIDWFAGISALEAPRWFEVVCLSFVMFFYCFCCDFFWCIGFRPNNPGLRLIFLVFGSLFEFFFGEITIPNCLLMFFLQNYWCCFFVWASCTMILTRFCFWLDYMNNISRGNIIVCVFNWIIYFYFAKLMVPTRCCCVWIKFCRYWFWSFARVSSHFRFVFALLMLCDYYIGSTSNLLCILLLDWFFFAKSPLLISIDVFLPKIVVADLYRLHEFCAPNGSCLILLRVYRHCVLTQD